jgi:hypothetical protein
VDSDRYSGRVRLLPPTLEATMQTAADRPEAPTGRVHVDDLDSALCALSDVRLKMGRSFEKALGLVLAVLGAPILGLLLATAGLPVLPSTLVALVAGFWFYLAWEKAQ